MNGGSNYISITGKFPDSVLLADYADNRDTVRSQLQAMFDNGQRVLSLLVWFADTDAYGHTESRWSHMFNSHSGDLDPQYKQNISEVLQIAQQIGFNEIHFRFPPQLNALPEWPSWDENQYQQNTSFIFNVRNLVASNVSVKTIFDIAPECIDSKDHYTQYFSAIWSDYTLEFGNSDVAMSIIAAHRPAIASNNIKLLVNTLKQQNLPLPSVYLVDCYGNEYLTLKGMHDGLVSVGQGGKPIFLQECYYNDPATAAELKKLKLKQLKGLCQWPWQRTAGMSDPFAPGFPQAYNKYANL